MRLRLEVVAIQSSPLHSNDSQYIAPLPVRRPSADLKPAQLLRQDVFGRVHVDTPAVDLDLTPSLQLQAIDRRSAGHKKINLDLRLMMDQIRTSAFSHRSLERIGVEIER